VTTTPLPGAFGLSRIGGRLGAYVAAAQAFTGDGSRFTHAFLVVDGGWTVQAEPGGARLAPLADRLRDPDVRFCDCPVRNAVAEYRSLHPDADMESFERNLRAYIVTTARGLTTVRRRNRLGRERTGVPYSFADYLYLGLEHWGVRSDWLRRRIASSGHMICSQLVDSVYSDARVHLFDDGRWPQDVTPGDLDLYRVTQLEIDEAARGGA
jgi:hypothetical protein